MRSGQEIVDRSSNVDELHQRLLNVGAALVDAMNSIPDPDQVPPLDRVHVQEIRWATAEALRLNRHYRQRLANRLAGVTPGQSHTTSMHDPPDACQERSSPT